MPQKSLGGAIVRAAPGFFRSACGWSSQRASFMRDPCSTSPEWTLR
jgi:hypothetical protein